MHAGEHLLGDVGVAGVDLHLVAVGAVCCASHAEVAPAARVVVGQRPEQRAEEQADEHAEGEDAEEAAGVEGEEQPEQQAPEEADHGALPAGGQGGAARS